MYVDVVPLNLKLKSEAKKLKHKERRAQCVAHKLATPEQALDLKSKECYDLLVRGLKLQTAREAAGPPAEEETATINISKGIGTNNRISALWCPEAMGLRAPLGCPEGVRGQVIDLARTHLCDGNESLTDDQVISKAIDASSFFTGLWMLIEVEIGLITRSMAQWTRGNIRPFFDALPYLAQIVGRAQKPKIARAMLYKLERLAHYNDNHPDILTFFSENCLALRETRIEDWHSILTHYVNKHVREVQAKHYERGSCMAQQVRGVKNDLKEHLFDRKPKAEERLGLLDNLHGKAFNETNEDVAEVVLSPFRDMILQIKEHGRCRGAYADELWPRSTRLPDGQSNLMTALDLTEEFHAQWVSECTPNIEPEGLLAWLNHRNSVVKMVHDPEIKRRGLSKTGTKAKKSQRIFDHVVANPNGFMDKESGVHCRAKPLGYEGDLPTENDAHRTAGK